MTDFISSFWAYFIAAITLGGLAFCMWLLFISRLKVKSQGPVQTTGHVWDGTLAELNNPMPRWWVGLFIATIVFALVYLVMYPGLAVSSGRLNWTSVNQHEQEKAAAAAKISARYAEFMSKGAAELAQDPKAMAIGERLFANNCAACHGSDARGSKGFPNLSDTDWLYGGEFETIKTTITQGRQGNMPPMIAAVGTPQDLSNLAHYVLSLSGSPHESIKAQVGKAKFGACAACHGPDGKGNPAMGAPNLTDKVWLHGWGEAAIAQIVTHGKHNVMPAQEKRLSPEQIHVLAAWVWHLSNTGAAAAPMGTASAPAILMASEPVLAAPATEAPASAASAASQ